MITYDKSNYDFKRFSKKDEVRGVDKFKTFDGVKEISDGIYSYKNFMGEQFNRFITYICNSFTEQEYKEDHYAYAEGDLSKMNDELSEKLISAFAKHPDAEQLLLDIRQLLAPEYSLLYYTEFIRLQSNQKALSRPIKENIVQPKYKLGYFCGDFTGGEIIFKHNKLHHKVEPDELVIFDSSYMTSVKRVKSGTRYVYMTYVYEDPGVVMV